MKLAYLKRRKSKGHTTNIFKIIKNLHRGKRNTVLQVNRRKGHRLVVLAGYIYHGKHYDKLGGYKDLTESLDKTVPEITRADVSLLRPELPG